MGSEMCIRDRLGLKIQHALRAFTAKDRKAIKLAAQNYPLTDFYEVDELLTQLGIGEAIVTALSEKGIPTPLAHTLLRAPQSRMDVLTNSEIKHIISQSEIIKKYNIEVDRESAYEILGEKIELAKEEEHQAELQKQQEKAAKATTKKRSTKEEKSAIEKAMDNTAVRQVGRTVARELTRGLLGALGVKTTRRRRNRLF